MSDGGEDDDPGPWGTVLGWVLGGTIVLLFGGRASSGLLGERAHVVAYIVVPSLLALGIGLFLLVKRLRRTPPQDRASESGHG